MAELADVRFDDVEGARIVRISGEIDLSNAWSVARVIRDAVSNVLPRVVVDLSELRYLDSAGIRVFFELARRQASQDQRLVIVLPPASAIRRSVEVSALPSEVTITETVHKATSVP